MNSSVGQSEKLIYSLHLNYKTFGWTISNSPTSSNDLNTNQLSLSFNAKLWLDYLDNPNSSNLNPTTFIH